MKTGKKIIFTENAKERLEKFHFEINQEIENYFQRRKYVPGDDFIEITSLDIDEVTNRYRIVRPSMTNIKILIPILYTGMGIFLSLVGLFYDQIKLIIEHQPERLIFIIGGLSMLLASWYYNYFIRLKEQRNKLVKTIIEEQQKEKSSSFQENDETIKGSKSIKDIKNIQSNIIIHSAKYFCKQNWINVTAKVKELVSNNIFEFTVSNDLMGGDPYFGEHKTLEIEFTINGVWKKIAVAEKMIAKIG